MSRQVAVTMPDGLSYCVEFDDAWVAKRVWRSTVVDLVVSGRRAREVALEAMSMTVATLCSDCPPEGYPTDDTRCTPCPRRAAMSQIQP